MQAEIMLHPFIIPDETLVEKLQEKCSEGDLFIHNDLEAAAKKINLLCFGWVNFVKFENGIVTFICRVLEDTDKQLAINYNTDRETGEKKIVNLYLV